MVERLNHGWYDDDQGDDDLYYGVDSEDEFDEDLDDERQEPVEHGVGYAADEAETGLDGHYGRWGKAGRRRKGTFVPLDTRTQVAPAFVRIKDLQDRYSS